MPGWLSLYRVRVSTCSGTSPWVFRRYRARRSFLDPKKRALGGLSSIWGEGTGRRYQEIRGLPIPHMGPAFSTLSLGGGLVILHRRVADKVALVVKNPPANAGRLKRCGFNPWAGKIPWSRKWQPTPCLENPMDRGAWWTVVHRSHRVGHD